MAPDTAAKRDRSSGPAARRRPPKALRLIVAGGGTGGHLFPGIAIAEEFIARNAANRVLFASSGRPFERTVLAAKGFEHRAISAAGLKGQGLFKQLRALLIIPRGLLESLAILRAFGPDLVLSVGGYSAGPMALAAWLRRVPVVLQEQNTLPGITNRLLGRLARRVYTAFAESERHFAARKVLLTGNPVRREILACRTAATAAPSPERERPFTVLVVGGSQGAHRINLAVIESLPLLGDSSRVAFIHQTGADDEASVAEAYRRSGITATVRAFFDDMDAQYRRADLIVCRAGATTVAELTVVGRGVIFVPYPFAADDHQVLNARALVAAGAAEMILEKDLDGGRLAERVAHYAARPRQLAAMAVRARDLGRPDAAARIVDDICRLLGGEHATQHWN